MPLRVAVAGLGFGRHFARIFRDHPECELIAVTDLDPRLVAETSQELGVARPEASLETLLTRDDVEAVALFTHAPRHAEHTLAALAARKHVLCAVPAALTFAECESLVRAVRDSGLVYASAETSYWRPETAQCRQWYREG